MELIDIVNTYFYAKSGRFNPNVFKRRWWEIRNIEYLYDKVIESTEFLDDNISWKCRAWHIKHNIFEMPVCKNRQCNNKVKWFENCYQSYCSVKCNNRDSNVVDQRKQTMIERYGAPTTLQSKELKEKVKNTNLEKYGVENPLSNKDVQEKVKNTNLDRYGVENPLSNKEIRSKRDGTMLEKYGAKHTLQSNELKEKVKNTNLEKYGSHNAKQQYMSKYALEVLSSSVLFLEMLSTNSYKSMSAMLDVSETTIRVTAHKHGVPLNYSSFENEVASYIESLGHTLVRNKRAMFGGKEIDIFISDKQIAIECNGSYWHSENQGKDKKYHLNKTELCNEQGIHLIHIWEHNWYQNQDLIKSRLKSKLGLNDVVYARKTHIDTVSSENSKLFLNDNHIQGFCLASVRYGLYYNDELVALMTFGKSRYKKDVEWELIRYCSKQGVNVVGGASKLFKHFQKTQLPKSIISYSDRMWNTGSLYEKLGFNYSHSTSPAYYYTKNYTSFENRVAYQKHKIKDKLEVFDPNLTEWHNMQVNGFDRIWDCGNDVWLHIN